MFNLTEAEIINLLNINEIILNNLKKKRSIIITKIMNLVNRNNYLNAEKEELTTYNLEEIASFNEKLDWNYTKLNPITNEIIWHGQIRNILKNKQANVYINPLEVYKYYKNKSSRLTVLKLFYLVIQHNSQYMHDDLSFIGRLEHSLTNYWQSGDSLSNNGDIISLFSNYLKFLELEYQKSELNLNNIKSVKQVNKELIKYLEKVLKSEEKGLVKIYR